jgi:integrase
MSEVLLDPRLVQRRLNPLPPSDPAAPYDPKELVALRSWASTQSTLARRTNAEVLLALGAGAGLSAIEIGELRVEDIEIDSDGVVVRTHGARTRAIPVLRDWEDALVERQRALAPDKFAFRENHAAYYPNLITNFVDRSRVVGVRPQSQRLRSTWILRHLEAATPVDLLMQAAGVESLEALTRYVKFVSKRQETATRALLRDPLR